MNDIIHIAISSDENYSRQAIVLIHSIFQNCKDNCNIHIHLLSHNIVSDTLNKIQKHIPKKGKLSIYKMDNIKQMLGVAVPSTISIASYCRLFLPSILSNDIEKIIYLDCDGLVTNSISGFFNIDFEDNLVGGVLDFSSENAKKAISIDSCEPYINAGALLINISQWRKENIQQKILDYLIANNGKVFHHDQGLINKICAGRKKILSPQYNLMTTFFLEKSQYYSDKTVASAIENPVFIHFTPSVCGRPWQKGCKHQLTSLYLNYCKEANILDFPEKDTRPLKLKFLTWSYFNLKPLYSLILKVRNKLINRP